MTKEALIQLGLSEEQAERVLALHSETAKNLVPKEKLDESETEKAQLTASLAERDKQLNTPKTAVGADGELKKKLEEAIAQNKADSEKHAAEFAEYKKDNAVNLLLMKSGAKNVTAVRALLDISKVSIDGENVIGLQDQIDALKESDPYLFEPAISGREPYSGDKTTADELKNNPFKKETFNLTRQCQIARDNPELAKRLKAAAGIKA